MVTALEKMTKDFDEKNPVNLLKNKIKNLTSGGFSREYPQHSTAQHSTAQHSTAQHSTAQHSTAQHLINLTNLLPFGVFSPTSWLRGKQ